MTNLILGKAYVQLTSAQDTSTIQELTITGFTPGTWNWTNRQATGGTAAQLPLTQAGVYSLSLTMREDGLRLDRLLLTSDTATIPSGLGLAESTRLLTDTQFSQTINQVIDYDYDNLYRLISATYSTNDIYSYAYDPVGNRLQQIINGDTTDYLYDDANRLQSVDGVTYSYDNNGNLLNTGTMTNTWDTANRLISSQRDGATIEPIYNGIGERIGQINGTTTTHFALDATIGLPEVIYTSQETAYLHLPGVIMTENSSGETRYLLSDGLGSIRQAVDDSGAVVAYNAFDPYGNPLESGSEPYGFTGEWWEKEVNLLHLRARWYLPENGTFLSRDSWTGDLMRPDTLHGYSYAANNPINYRDPSGFDYIEWLDRYTCDDPKAQSGHVYQYDKATCTWGLWPCIVDPNNVTTEGPAPSSGSVSISIESPSYADPTIHDNFINAGVPATAEEVVESASSNVQGLIQLFEADHFPGKNAKGRLRWILDITGSPRALSLHFSSLFPLGDSGFCEELADGSFYDNEWIEANSGPTKQMGHFLTAVSLGFDPETAYRNTVLLFDTLKIATTPYILPDNPPIPSVEEFALNLIVGHEMIGDQKHIFQAISIPSQYNAATSEARDRFLKAVDYDRNRSYGLRDSELRAILIATDPRFQNPNLDVIEGIDRVGNSMQDLRLSVKGWRFGQEIRYETVQTRQQAADWLRREVYDPARTR